MRTSPLVTLSISRDSALNWRAHAVPSGAIDAMRSVTGAARTGPAIADRPRQITAQRIMGNRLSHDGRHLGDVPKWHGAVPGKDGSRRPRAASPRGARP